MEDKRKIINAFVSLEDEYYNMNLDRVIRRGTLIELHLADLHMGAFREPKLQYQILYEQCIKPLAESDMRLDIIAIDGDMFHQKYNVLSEAILYANKFMYELVMLSKLKGATLVIIDGTNSHDSGQLKLFYHYLNDPELDIRIIEKIQFEYIKGAKILCIPELYNVDEVEYTKHLLYSGIYDSVFMHGTIKGSIYGDTVAAGGRLFTIDDFKLCRGPIISGHVHTGGCFDTYFYYTGSPYTWQFGEEGEKGYLLVMHDLDSGYHYCKLMPIKSFRYITIAVDTLLYSDPRDIINHISQIKKDENIDYIRIQFSNISDETRAIIRDYYKNEMDVKLQFPDRATSKVIEAASNNEDYEKYSFIFNKNLTPYQILAQYINIQENSEIITAEELEKIVLSDI